MISGTTLCAKHASDASGRYEPKADIWCHAHATATRTHVSLASMFYAYAGVGEQCGAFVHDHGRVRMYARMHAYSRSHACVCVCRHTRRVMVRTPIVLPMRLRWTGIGAESSPILSIEMYTARSKTPFATYTNPALVPRIVQGTSGTNGRDYCDALSSRAAGRLSTQPKARRQAMDVPWKSRV